MPKTKVALVLSGGSSLGSYIAGALDELLKAFAAASDKYEIDIITGASAGATTAAIIAHGLLYRGGNTMLNQVWVDTVDMVDLLDRNLPDTEQISLLSSHQLIKIAQDVISWDGSQKPVAAPFVSPQLTLAMTITNYTPIPYTSRVMQPAAGRTEAFVQFRHAEQETFLLKPATNPPTDPLWQRITTVARASAAIPLVFPLVQLERNAGDTNQYPDKPDFDGTQNFWYYDGGTFNNLPVDLAWYLINEQAQPGEDPLQNRVLIIVNPWRSDISALHVSPQVPGVTERFFGLITALHTESSTIQFQNEVLMPSAAANQQVQSEASTRAIAGIDRPPVDLLNNFALVMPTKEENAAHRLKGNHLHGLAAFLDRRFREYDFRRGAADAQQIVRDILAIANYDSGHSADYYTPDNDPALNVDLSDYANLDHIPSTRDPRHSVKQVFENALDGRIDALIHRWKATQFDLLLDPIFSHVVKDIAHQNLPKLWNV